MWWMLQMTFYNSKGLITEYGEMRNKFPRSKEEFEVMAKDSMQKETKKFCYFIKKVRKSKDF